jgi:hypothetical protein
MVNPPKYSCMICNKMFRRHKQHYNHVIRNKCGVNRIVTGSQGTGKAMTLGQIQQEYHGRNYSFNPIPTGNRHYRTGIPLPRISNYHSRSAI